MSYHTPDVLKRLEEQLADAQHDIWSHWMRWFFENDTEENRQRWRRQMVTPYAELAEHEKESDRRVVREFVLPVLKLTRALLESQGELMERVGNEECKCDDAARWACPRCGVLARAEKVRKGEV